MSYKKPNEFEDWDSFVTFVSTQLGDIPVLSNGSFIGQKILYYWAVWRIETDVFSGATVNRGDAMIQARRYWVKAQQESLSNQRRTA